MDVIEKKSVDTVVDTICDVCDASLNNDYCGHTYKEGGILSAQFGYGSKQDGKAYHLDLCVTCFMFALSNLKEQRRVNTMFDGDKTQPDNTFGLDATRTSRI